MENYILSLIKENNRVIVPNFGAFIVAKENGFSVLFNNFLSFNDGLLVDHIVSVKNISREDAEKEVDKYVEQLKHDLDENGSYTINGLGTFTKDATGILRFEQSNELTGEQSTSETVVEKEKSDDLLDIDSSTSEAQDNTLESKETPLFSSSVNDTTPIAEFEDDVEPTKDETPTFAGKAVFGSKDDTKDMNEPKEDPVAVANKYLNEDNSKRNRSIVIFLSLFILLPLIGFSIYFFFIKDNSPSKTKQQISEVQKTDTKAVELQPAAGTIEAGPDTSTQHKVDAEPIKEPQQHAEAMVKKPHQLIVGSFSNEANADKMIVKLKAKGYDQCFYFLHNNRYLVSLEAFAKVYEAQARQEEILNKERMESWIITKRK